MSAPQKSQSRARAPAAAAQVDIPQIFRRLSSAEWNHFLAAGERLAEGDDAIIIAIDLFVACGLSPEQAPTKAREALSGRREALS